MTVSKLLVKNIGKWCQ